MPVIDLTPFGFTPTESLAYQALSELGPQTGYGLAQALTIARANAYQALRGLVAKGAVTRTAERPERYRPLQPDALLALITNREAAQLDRLDAALSAAPATGGPVLIPIAGERTLLDLATRTAARAVGTLLCLAPGPLLVALAPAWHKRAQGRSQTMLWSLGERPTMPLAAPLAGHLDAASVARFFPELPLILATPSAAIVASPVGRDATGYWTSVPVLVQTTNAMAFLLPLTQSAVGQ